MKSYKLFLSPYDVRYGNFAGALINAVTKSGSNSFTGSTYYYKRDSTLTRSQSYLAGFNQAQYDATLGGPILKTNALFIINPDRTEKNKPDH